MPVIWLLPLIPACFAIGAVITRRITGRHNQWLAEGVAFSCALICGLVIITTGNPALWALVAAFALSIGGDMFLTYRTKDLHYVAGIGLFLLAHIGFLVYAVTRVPFSWLQFLVIAALGIAFYFTTLRASPNLKTSPALSIAVLVYMLVSCASLAAALDPTSHSPARWVFVAGIASLVASDIMIAFRDFRGVATIRPWIMPLYFLCHILVTVSVVTEMLVS